MARGNQVFLLEFAEVRASDPVWLKLMLEDRDKDFAEVPGRNSNPLITECYEDCSAPRPKDIDDSKVPWCSYYAGSRMKRAQFPTPPDDDIPAARSWKTNGTAMAPDKLKRGAILVLYRGADRTSWQRHVGFYLGETDTHYIVWGGNQSNDVTPTLVAKRQLDMARWPVAATKKALKEAGSTEVKLGDNMKKAAGTIIGGSILAETGAQASNVINSGAVPVADPVLTEQLRVGAENIGYGQSIATGLHGVMNLFGGAPWLFVALVGGLGLWWVGNKVIAWRIEKHKAGVPLSKEVKKTAAHNKAKVSVVSKK
jgi:hypothetical protein